MQRYSCSIVDERNEQGDLLLFNAFVEVSCWWGPEGSHTLPLLLMDDAEEEGFGFAAQQSWGFRPHKSPWEEPGSLKVWRYHAD